MSVWFIKGIPDDGYVRAIIDDAGEWLFSTGGSINVAWKLKPYFETAQVTLPGPLPKRSKPDLIVNEISSPENQTTALQLCARICERFECPVVNDPRVVARTDRVGVVDALSGIPALTVPATIRCTPESPDELIELAARHRLGDAILVREAGQHGGRTLERIILPGDHQRLHRFAYDGRAFYVSTYVDYQSEDGLYRKFRFACVGNDVMVRHLLIGEHWMVHASARRAMEGRPDLLAEEREVLRSFDTDVMPRIAPTLRAIHAAIGLDYLGIDAHVDEDGRLLLFEANPNMNMLINTRADKAAAQPYIDAIVECFRRLMETRMESHGQRIEVS